MGGEGDGRGERPAVGLLFVCTGNICRSPVAERLARRRMTDVLGDPALVHIESAGVRGVVGSAIHPASAAALRDLGGEPTGFVARRLVPPMVEGADLVLTMTRDHRRSVLELAPRALSRTFTLREAAHLVGMLADPAPVHLPTPRDRVRDLVRRMAAARARVRGGPGDDVDDPMGRPDRVHEETCAVIARSLRPLLDALLTCWEPPAAGGPAQ